MLDTFVKVRGENPDLVKIGQNIRHFTERPKNIVGSNMKYSVAQKHCKWKPLLHFHDNTHQFYIVYSDMYLSKTKGMRY
jgi:hypothetical protein